MTSERVWLKFWLLGLKVEYVAEDAGLAFGKLTGLTEVFSALKKWKGAVKFQKKARRSFMLEEMMVFRRNGKGLSF